MNISDWKRTQILKHSIQKFFYFSRIENLASILKDGILPKNFVQKNRVQSASFAEESVQERRHSKIVELSDNMKMPLHDLVPLYLTPRTPTLSIRRDIQSELFFLDISLDAVCDDLVPFAFTDGNAGSNNTKFFCNLGKLSEISWDVISARYWNDYDDGKRKRCSEFLIYPGIKPRYFERIVVLTAPLAQQCAATVKQSGVDLKVVVLRDYFFV